MSKLWAAAAAVLLLVACEPLDPMRNRQQKVLPYQGSTFYADGVSMRAPPEGSVAVEEAIDPRVAAGGEADGRPVAQIPVPVTRELIQTGRKRFEIVCAACHGLTGDGQSMVARNMSLRRPPSLLQDQYVRRPDGYFYQVMSRGFGLMPSYAAELPVDERWAIVAYVRALQLSQRGRIEQAPPDVRTRLEKESR